MTTKTKSAEKEIRDLIGRWNRAVEAKDGAAIVQHYTPKSVLYDAIPPYKTVGGDAIRAAWEQCFPYFPEKFRSEHKDLTIDVAGDVAFVHGLHHFVAEPADHPVNMTWMRVTACYRREKGAWKVAHEHVSVPFDPMSGKASFIKQAGKSFETHTPDGACGAPTAKQAVTPHIVCADAAKAISFYEKAFGAVEKMRLPAPNGKLMHAALEIAGGTVMLVDENPEWGCVSPLSLKGSPVTVHLYVDDVDAVFARAVKAGAKVKMPVADMFWGDRYGIVTDPFGHAWSIATHQRDMTVAEIDTAMRSAMKAMEMSGECVA